MLVRTRMSAVYAAVVGLIAALLILVAPTSDATVRTSSPDDAPVVTAALGMGTPNCGRHTVLKTNGKPWTCVFSDYFGGTKLNSSKWRTITSKLADLGDKTACYTNSRYNAAVSQGVLKLVTRRNLKPFSCKLSQGRQRTSTSTSVVVSTYEKFAFARGRVSIRAKFPYAAGRGVQSALWLYPEAATLGSLASGEIDFAEWYSVYPRKVIPYLHYNLGLFPTDEVTNTDCIVKNVGNWHVYTLEWTSSYISIKYDGVECLRNKSGVALGQFTQPSFLNLMMAQGVRQNSPVSTTPNRAMTQIDWVRVWK